MTARLALGLVVVAAGLLWLLSAADVVDLSYSSWIGLLLIAIGLGIVASRGRHGLLVVAGILVLLAGVPAIVVGDDLFEGGIGEKTERPQTAAELEPFRVGIGKLTVDLTDAALDDVRVEASVGIGELLVLVPPNAEIDLDAHVGVGNVQALSEEDNGVDVDVEQSFPGPVAGGRFLGLELETGIGNIRVERR